MCRYKLKQLKHSNSHALSSKVEITWPHLAELARQSSIISRSGPGNEMDIYSQQQDVQDFVDDTMSQSTSFNTMDPAFTQTIISQQSFNSKVLRHYQYEISPNHGSVRTCKSIDSTTMSHRPYVPPYVTDSVQSSPRTVRKSTTHSDSPKSKKERSDGTETSNSWQAEKIEESAAYKARAKKLWKQAQESPVNIQAVV